MDPAWIPPWGGWGPGASHLTFIFRFWIHFWPIENAPKIHLPKRHPKISKFRPCGAQASFLHPFREPFLDSFLMNTLKSRNLLKRNKHRTGALQSPIRASHFGIKNQCKFHVFSGIVFGNPFSHIFQNSFQKGIFCVPFGIQLEQKWHPKSAPGRVGPRRVGIGIALRLDLALFSFFACCFVCMHCFCALFSS